MPRKNRQETVVNDSIHHILQRGLSNCPIFREESDYEYYRSLILRYKDKHEIAVYNYCLMPNHIHMLLYVNESTNLSKFIQALSLAYSAHYRKSYGHSGYLWQGRYRNLLINDKSHLLECARYIERNPLRSADSPVSDLSDHKWSSYNFYARGVDDGVITENPLFNTLGIGKEDRRLKYRDYVLTQRPYDQMLEKFL